MESAVSEEGRSRRRGRVFVPILIGVMFGVVVGLGGFTFIYAKGGSYLGNDPQACANCHVMGNHLKSWERGSHRNVATCNDCHAPHDFFGKMWVKAKNGLHHSWAFTTGDFPVNIRITEGNRAVTEGACRSCHADLVDRIDAPHAEGAQDQSLSCIRCHSTVGHLE